MNTIELEKNTKNEYELIFFGEKYLIKIVEKKDDKNHIEKDK